MWRPQRSSIRKNFFLRSFLDTHPKRRVPKTRFFRFIRITAFSSDQLELPSENRVCFLLRIKRAKCICPIRTFLTNRNFLTEIKIKSPGKENLRLNPPNNLIHSTKLAPELSLGFNQDCTWIIYIIVHLERFELSTYRSVNYYSIQLSYKC